MARNSNGPPTTMGIGGNASHKAGISEIWGTKLGIVLRYGSGSIVDFGGPACVSWKTRAWGTGISRDDEERYKA